MLGRSKGRGASDGSKDDGGLHFGRNRVRGSLENENCEHCLKTWFLLWGDSRILLKLVELKSLERHVLPKRVCILRCNFNQNFSFLHQCLTNSQTNRNTNRNDEAYRTSTRWLCHSLRSYTGYTNTNISAQC